MKTLSLLKATFSQDMNLFRYKSKATDSKTNKMILPVILFSLVGFSMGSYAYMMAEALAPANLAHIVLSIFMFIVTLIALIEGIPKSQGILFDAKDNELLFSLPISKKKIIFARILKLIVFEYLFNLMFLLPAFVVYSITVHPGVQFYFLALLMTILIPIIPTIISCFIGYAIRMVTTNSKSKKIIQTVITLAFGIGIMVLSMNIQNMMSSFAESAEGINNTITSIYYPIQLYTSLLIDFDIVNFLIVLGINVIPLVLFILIGSKFYFRLISKSKNNTVRNKMITEDKISVKRSKIKALLRKELKRYLSSPVYMVNTSFGLVLGVIGAVLIAIKGKDIVDAVLSVYEIQTDFSLPVIFYIFVVFCRNDDINIFFKYINGGKINKYYEESSY